MHDLAPSPAPPETRSVARFPRYPCTPLSRVASRRDDLTCAPLADYGALLVIDAEDMFSAAEVNAVAAAASNGLGVFVVADWADEALQKASRFFDDNTQVRDSASDFNLRRSPRNRLRERALRRWAGPPRSVVRTSWRSTSCWRLIMWPWAAARGRGPYPRRSAPGHASRAEAS